VLGDQGVYNLTLQATVDAQTIQSPFVVNISDPCNRAIFQSPASSPISDMTLIRDFDANVSQTFDILTDIESNFSLACGYTVQLVSPPGYVTLNGTTLTMTESLTSLSDVGVHNVTVKVFSSLYPTTVSSQSYTFSLIV
jgi:hypothetical protein